MHSTGRMCRTRLALCKPIFRHMSYHLDAARHAARGAARNPPCGMRRCRKCGARPDGLPIFWTAGRKNGLAGPACCTCLTFRPLEAVHIRTARGAKKRAWKCSSMHVSCSAEFRRLSRAGRGPGSGCAAARGRGPGAGCRRHSPGRGSAAGCAGRTLRPP